MADKRPYLCLVGTSPSTREKVPQDDPLAAIWGMGITYKWLRKCAAFFNVHSDVHDAEAFKDAPEYFTFLETLKVPLIMQRRHPRYPTSVPFPLREARRFFGIDYFHSSFDYMLALAIMQMTHPASPFRKEIRLFGIDLHPGDSYEYQLASASFYCGQAMARGIKVVVPESSSLLYTGHRYGYEEGVRNDTSTDDRMRWHEAEVESYINEVRNAELKQARAQGRLEEAKIWSKRRRF